MLLGDRYHALADGPPQAARASGLQGWLLYKVAACFVNYGAFQNKIRGAILGVPIIRTEICWGSILGSPCFGKLPYVVASKT